MTLASWKITDHTGCGCTDLANEMDLVGVDAVEKNFQHYVNKMYEGIVNWKATGGSVERKIPLPDIKLVAGLIDYGIKKSREEATA